MPAHQLPPAGQKDLNRRLTQTGVFLVTLLATGIVFVAMRTVSASVGAALLWAFACLVIGAIGGFLFAIPRVPKTGADTGQKDTDAKSRVSSLPGQTAVQGEDTSVTLSEHRTVTLVKEAERGFGLGINTNLEDISDWLTKMIVGIGLVELRSAPHHLSLFAAYIGKGLGPDMESVALSVVVYFTGLGLLSSYLLTRMFVGPAFLLADQATHSGIAYDTAQAAFALAQMEGEVSGAFDVLKRKDLQTANRLEHIINELSKYRTQFPLNRRLHITLGRVYRTKGDYDSAIRVLELFARRKRGAKELDLDLSDALFNIACYYSLQLGQAQEPSKQAIIKKALKAIKESLEICPENMDDVREDSDLKALWESDAGKKALASADFAAV